MKLITMRWTRIRNTQAKKLLSMTTTGTTSTSVLNLFSMLLNAQRARGRPNMSWSLRRSAQEKVSLTLSAMILNRCEKYSKHVPRTPSTRWIRSAISAGISSKNLSSQNGAWRSTSTPYVTRPRSLLLLWSILVQVRNLPLMPEELLSRAALSLKNGLSSTRKINNIGLTLSSMASKVHLEWSESR